MPNRTPRTARRAAAVAATFLALLAAQAIGPIVGTVHGPAAATERVMSLPEAEQTIAAQTANLVDPATCWESDADRAGRWPTTAVVKDDGGLEARTVDADTAWTQSHAGKVWVLAWCE